MTQGNLPTDDQIVRNVKPSMIQDDGSPDGSEFRLRSNENELSVKWIEVLGQEKARQLAEVRLLCR